MTICPHCEKGKLYCRCEQPPTLGSMAAQQDVHDLSEDLSPWPISNERAWYIINEHLELKRKIIKHQQRLIDAALRQLHDLESTYSKLQAYKDSESLETITKDFEFVRRLLGEEIEGSGS